MTREERAYRLDRMAWERMKGATIRALAARYRLSKSQVHRLLRHIEKMPPPARCRAELVPTPDGFHRVRYVTD
jgi:Mor family transcriptional regulator